jgi:uncharacterized membrane protein
MKHWIISIAIIILYVVPCDAKSTKAEKALDKFMGETWVYVAMIVAIAAVILSIFMIMSGKGEKVGADMIHGKGDAIFGSIMACAGLGLAVFVLPYIIERIIVLFPFIIAAGIGYLVSRN